MILCFVSLVKKKQTEKQNWSRVCLIRQVLMWWFICFIALNGHSAFLRTKFYCSKLVFFSQKDLVICLRKLIASLGYTNGTLNRLPSEGRHYVIWSTMNLFDIASLFTPLLTSLYKLIRLVTSALVIYTLWPGCGIGIYNMLEKCALCWMIVVI